MYNLELELLTDIRTSRPICPDCGTVMRSQSVLRNKLREDRRQWLCGACRRRCTTALDSFDLVGPAYRPDTPNCIYCGGATVRSGEQISKRKDGTELRKRKYRCKDADNCGRFFAEGASPTEKRPPRRDLPKCPHRKKAGRCGGSAIRCGEYPNGDRRYKCSACGSMWRNGGEIRKRARHPRPKCPHCGKKQDNIRRKKRTKNHRCDQCGRKFSKAKTKGLDVVWPMPKCKRCGSESGVIKAGVRGGTQRFRCLLCQVSFSPGGVRELQRGKGLLMQRVRHAFPADINAAWQWDKQDRIFQTASQLVAIGYFSCATVPLRENLPGEAGRRHTQLNEEIS